MRAALVAAGWVLVATGAVGCSDGGPGPGQDEAPSAQVFCDALGQFRADVQTADPADLVAYVRTLKEAAARLERIGTPEDMSDSARAGWELTIQRIEELPDDATQDDLTGLGDVGQDQQATLDDLDSYIELTCPDLSESESPSAGES
jgi:hypothetical protein